MEHFIILPVRAKRFGFSYWRRQAFFFNMSAWFALYEDYGWDFDAMGKIPPLEMSAKMIFEAAKQGNFKEGKPFSMGFLQLTEQVGGMRLDDGEKLKAVFAKSAQVVAEKMKDIGKKKSNVG